LLKAFPTDDGGKRFRVEEISAELVRLRMFVSARHLRPGATVSGPAQMAMADTAAWVLIMHNLGFEAAPSVTSNLNISFLSRPLEADLLATGRLLKLGKRLSVSEVLLHSEGREQPVAHATVTYAVQLAGR
jgi:uncharacterized protein (TIGR00369 family)